MNMRDLSKDDDFLSHLLVEKLGTGVVPLLVHKMDPTRRLPKTDADDLLHIVRRVSLVLFSIFPARSRRVHDSSLLPEALFPSLLAWPSMNFSCQSFFILLLLVN